MPVASLVRTAALGLLLIMGAESALADEPVFEPVYGWPGLAGASRLAPARLVQPGDPDEAVREVVFHALTAMAWPPGFIPIFAVERDGLLELRRLPPRGRENFLDPLFFALPLEDEMGVAELAGRWECTSVNDEGVRHVFEWEFAIEGERVAGRFDPNTDFRFAFLTGGSWRDRQLELEVEYIMDRYTVVGHWREGHLAGSWRRQDGAGEGTWEGSRPSREVSVGSRKAVPLYEWVRSADQGRRYTLESEWDEPGWKRAPRALCRVWAP